MKKENSVLVFALLIVIFSLGFSSATILIGQPAGMYNLGDSFEISITLSSETSTNDFLIADIVCGEKQVNVYRAPSDIESGQPRTVDLKFRLGTQVIGGLLGDCVLNAKYAEDERKSQNFVITSDVDVLIDSIKSVIDPGESIQYSGVAKKKNGDDLEGFVTVTIADAGISLSGLVAAGAYDVNIDTPENIPAGVHVINVSAYDKDNSGNVLNSGSRFTTLRINQIVKSVEIALLSPEMSLTEDFVINVLATDQSGESVSKNSKVEIYSPDNNIFAELTAETGAAINIAPNSSFYPGEWQVKADVEGVESIKTFNVPSVERISYSLENETLIVVNTGNVPYIKKLRLFIGDNERFVDLNLAVGEEIKFKLGAPEGYYPIAVKGDDGLVNALGTSFLTGKTISIDELGIFSAGSFFNILLIVLIILVLAALVFYYFKKIRKGKFVGKTPLKIFNISRAEHRKSEGIEKGQKQECAIIAVKIKNFEEIRKSTSNAVETIQIAMNKAKDANGKIMHNQAHDSWLIVFSPSVTKERDNGVRAVKSAKEIESVLTAHNKKFSQKIKFGIGVTVGELIVDMSSGDLKFASAGNAIISAKRIAEQSAGMVLLSDEAHRKTINEVKVEKAHGGNWKITRFVDRGSKNSQFIERFMKRNY